MVPEENKESFTPVILQTVAAAQLDSLAPTATATTQALAEDLEADLSLSSPELMERRGFVRQMPQFHEQVADAGRDMPIRFKTFSRGYRTMTEHEALSNFWGSMAEFLEVTETPKRAGHLSVEDVVRLREDARSIMENMNFVGHPEYKEAVAGIAEHWKAFLDADPENVLCLHAGVSQLPRFQPKVEGEARKSDDWLMEDILLGFSAEELDVYRSRIVGTDHPNLDPDHTRIVLMDDWSISGSQLTDAFNELAARPEMQPLIDAGCVEINLLVASGSQLRGGLQVPHGEGTTSLPIVSYFRAHDADVADAPANHAHISGAHSAVNYGFRDLIREMMKAKDILQSHGKKYEKTMIPLLQIEGLYKDPRLEKLVGFVSGKLLMKNVLFGARLVAGAKKRREGDS